MTGQARRRARGLSGFLRRLLGFLPKSGAELEQRRQDLARQKLNREFRRKTRPRNFGIPLRLP
ncbi:MAG: hypothetical protein KGJ34_00135 [Patescibacteria group bacterium]|nr:hypothetical protein [Patescibacteria group bacterium]